MKEVFQVLALLVVTLAFVSCLFWIAQKFATTPAIEAENTFIHYATTTPPRIEVSGPFPEDIEQGPAARGEMHFVTSSVMRVTEGISESLDDWIPHDLVMFRDMCVGKKGVFTWKEVHNFAVSSVYPVKCLDTDKPKWTATVVPNN